MSRKTLGLGDELYRYVLDNTLRESDVLRRLREQTAEMTVGNMQIAPDQGQFMALLVELTGAERIIEVGTFTGYSALCMAQALPDDGELICCDVSEEFTAIAREHWQAANVDGRIDLQLRPAIETLDRLIDEGFEGAYDFAYIDADKGGYRAYVEACLTLVRPGGLIALDNVLWGGSVADSSDEGEDTLALRDVNTWIHARAPGRYDLSLVPIGDGLTVMRKYF